MRCVLVVAAVLAASSPSFGQDVRAVAVAVPDTIRIGEPFTLGIAVRSESDSAATFPNLLIIGEDLEQLAGAEFRRHGDEPGEWRAYYRLTAWTVDSPSLPAVTVDLHGPSGTRSITVAPPTLAVESVLPADTVPVWLEPPRPPVSLRNWLWLLLLLLAALIAWYLIRRWLAAAREEPAEDTVVSDPAAKALAALNELVESFERGDVEGAPYFDRLEAILRDYLEATRSLPPGGSMRLLATDVEAAGEVAAPPPEVLELSGLIRFARLHAVGAPEVAAVRECSAWVERDRAIPAAPDATGEEAP